LAKKRSRQTFEKIKREQAVKEKRVRKQERRDAAKAAKLAGDSPDGTVDEFGSDGEPDDEEIASPETLVPDQSDAGPVTPLPDARP